MRYLGRLLCLAGTTATALAFAAAPAGAAIGCVYDAGTEDLTVTATAEDDIALLGAGTLGGEIMVFDAVANVQRDCGAVDPTGAITDTIVLKDTDVNSTWSLADPETLGPGTGGTGEVEVILNLGAGFDAFILFDGNVNVSADNWVLGANGLNWNNNVDNDVDVALAPFGGASPEQWFLNGNDGADTIDAQGSSGTGGFFAGPGTFSGSGGDGVDIVQGGATTNDDLFGGDGDDFVRGFGGNDELTGGGGGDQLDGGTGTDAVDFGGAPGPVSADLAAGTATGEGADSLLGIETLAGSPAGDTFVGNDGPNALLGGDGDDTLRGRDGADSLFGGFNSSVPGADGDDTLEGGPGVDSLLGEEGIDTVTYANAPAGVSVDLGSGVVSGGAGADVVVEVENLIGSPFADTLTGSNEANSMIALTGQDTVSALGGSDSVDVRDGGPDTASCGTELDTAIADQATVDAVDPDCETVSFLPSGDTGGNGDGGGGGGASDTEVAFDLSGKKRQRVLEQRGVIVKASCPAEDCTATATGSAKLPKPRREPRAKFNLRPVTEPVAGGVAERLKLKLKRRQLRALAAALRAGKRPKLRVSASVVDAAGNAAMDSLTVRARR